MLHCQSTVIFPYVFKELFKQSLPVSIYALVNMNAFAHVQSQKMVNNVNVKGLKYFTQQKKRAEELSP